MSILPQETYETLKCSMCNYYLSVPPIKLDVNLKYVCGRCIPNPMNSPRLRIYEALATKFTFPCSFVSNGCTKKLVWNSALDHEANCKHAMYLCSVFSLGICSWSGSTSELKRHFTESHNNLIVTWNYFHVPKKNPGLVNKLLFHKDMVFVAQTYLENNLDLCWMGLYILSNFENLEYSFKVIVRCGNNTAALGTRPVHTFLKGPHNIIKMTPLRINNMKEVLGGADLLCKFELITVGNNVQKAKEAPTEIPKPIPEVTKNPTKNNAIDEKMLQELECPICCDYMVSPIYICLSGHSLCGTCETKVKYCPQCKTKLLKTRNYALEKLAKLMKYPCHNYQSHCNFVGTYQELAMHEKLCYDAIHCPVNTNCAWKGLPNAAYNHAIAVHPENCLLELNTCIHCLIGQTATDIQIVQFNDNTFKVCRQQVVPKGPIRWAVKHLNLKPNEQPKYRFELDFVDQTRMGRKLVLNGFCCARKKLDEDDFTDYLNLSVYLLTPFVYNQEVLNYIIRFEKI